MKKNDNELIAIMRIGVIVLGVVLATAGSALSMEGAYSQHLTEKVVSLTLEKEVTLERALKEIRKKYSIDFTYNNTELRKIRVPELMIANQTLGHVLNTMLSAAGYTFKETGESIVVYRSRKPVPIIPQDPDEILPSISIHEEEDRDVAIKGRVTEMNGNPLSGVTISVKDVPGIGASSDHDGAYRISVPQAGSVLVFSIIGYHSKEVVVNAQSTTIDVVLQENSQLLDDVIVVGYGTQKKVNLTGAVSQIDSKVLDDRPVSNITQAIQGAMPNVNIRFTTGRPGTEGGVNVRGYASINSANASPLILIDGVPGTLNNINPRDVESISVLKDAAAASIYGARGAFGVMLVTTKQGKGGRMNLSYSNNFGLAGSTVSTDFMTDGYDAAIMNDEAFIRATGNSYTGYTEKDYEELFKRKTDKSLPNVVIENRNGNDQYIYYGSTDWWSEMYRDNQTSMEHALSFTGGTDKLNFFLSGRMYEKNGLMRINQDKFKSYNLRGKVEAEVASWLKVSNNVQLNYNNYTYPGWNGNANANNNFISTTVHALPSYLPVNPDGTATYRTELNNYNVGDGIYADLLHGKSKGADGEYEFVNSLQGLFQILPDLHVTANYTFNHNPQHIFSRRTQAPWSIYPGIINYLGNDALTEIDTKNNHHIINIFADYTKKIGTHNFKFMAGYNQEHVTYKRITAIRNDLLSEDLNDVNLGSGDMQVTGGANAWALMGYFGRINYDYAGKYLLEVNGRYDGTSKFPDGQRFGFFPSVSAGWRLSEENFFQPLKPVLSEFKLRASYGALGNAQEASVYGYIPLLNRGNTDYLTDGRKTEFLAVPTPISPRLTWERTTTLNFGVDAGFFTNRLNATFDWYIRNTFDMLIPGKNLPAVYGAASPKENAGDLRNTGWEISLAWQDQTTLAGKPFTYNVGVGVSDSKAEITRFDNREMQLNNHYVGQQLGEIWGYRVDGLFRSDEEAANWQINQDYVDQQRLRAPGEWSQLKGGDMKFVDLNNDGKVDAGVNTLDNPGDQTIIGNSLPRYTFGFNLGANWEGLDISAFFQGIGRQHWYPGNNSDKFWGPYSRPYYSFVPREFANDIWTPENTDAYYPLLRGYIALNDRGSLNVKNDRYLQDLAYIRLKNLTVGYTLPHAWLQNAKISRARIYVSGENLFTATKLRSDYIDPEQASGETNGRTYPFSKTFSFGLDITF